MTVVANALIEGIPALIGDAVITSSDPSVNSINVPTVRTLPRLRTPITDFVRKVYIIEKRLTIAWTGSKLKAMQLIPSLRDHIKRHGVTEKELNAFLSSYQYPRPGGDKLLLIGWIAQRDPRPFWWSSEYPDEIVYDEYDIEGRGETIFRSSFFARDMAVKGPGLTHEEHVFLNCLAGISRLLTLETTQGLPLVHGFGFCYDIVLWSKYRFKNIHSYTQVNVDVAYNSATKSGRVHFRNPTLIYNPIGNAGVFWSLRYGDEQHPDQSHKLLGTEPISIKSLLRDDMTHLPKARFHSKFFCTFFRITDENGFSIAAPFCITDEARPGDGMWLSKQGTREVLQFKMDIVTMIHTAACQQQRPPVSFP